MRLKYQSYLFLYEKKFKIVSITNWNLVFYKNKNIKNKINLNELILLNVKNNFEILFYKFKGYMNYYL